LEIAELRDDARTVAVRKGQERPGEDGSRTSFAPHDVE
jgi:hypothetical protein